MSLYRVIYHPNLKKTMAQSQGAKSLNNVAPTAASGGRSKMLPDGFPQLLKDVTREILRNYPQKPEKQEDETWIYEFAARYLKQQQVYQQRSSSSTQKHQDDGHPSDADADKQREDIANHLLALFQEVDDRNLGELPVAQFQETLRTLLDQLELPEWVLSVLLEEADEKESQAIDYQGESSKGFTALFACLSLFVLLLLLLCLLSCSTPEFIPHAVPLLQQALTSLSPLQMNEEVRQVVFIHGLSQVQFVNALRGIFEHVDSENTGSIPRSHVSVILREAGLGLTRQEVNGLMGLTTDDDIDYNNLCDNAVDICIGSIYRLYARNLLPHDTTHVYNALVSFLAQFDEQQTGRLPMDNIIQIIEGADLSLSNVQLHAVCGSSLVEEDGQADYSQLIEQSAQYIVTAIRVQTDKRTAEKLMQLREEEKFQKVAGMGYDEFMEWLNDRMKALGKDENSLVETNELRNLLEEELHLDAGTIQSVISIARNATKAENEGEDTSEIKVSALIDHAADVILSRQELVTLSQL